MDRQPVIQLARIVWGSGKGGESLAPSILGIASCSCFVSDIGGESYFSV
jgi:hypothetical protein